MLACIPSTPRASSPGPWMEADSNCRASSFSMAALAAWRMASLRVRGPLIDTDCHLETTACALALFLPTCIANLRRNVERNLRHPRARLTNVPRPPQARRFFLHHDSYDTQALYF